MEIETQDPNEIPRSFFWRAIFAIGGGIYRIVDGLFYHSSVQSAVTEFHQVGEVVSRSQGANQNELVQATVVERTH